MRKGSFNAIITKAKDSDSMVFIRYEGGDIEDSCYNLSLKEPLCPSEMIKGKFPCNKVILSNIRMVDENSMAITPKYCIELKIGRKKLNFWHIVKEPDHLLFLLEKLQKTPLTN